MPASYRFAEAMIAANMDEGQPFGRPLRDTDFVLTCPFCGDEQSLWVAQYTPIPDGGRYACRQCDRPVISINDPENQWNGPGPQLLRLETADGQPVALSGACHLRLTFPNGGTMALFG